MDVTSETGWRVAVETAEAKYGPVSVLVNNASVSLNTLIEETDPEAWRRVIDMNLTGQFLGIRPFFLRCVERVGARSSTSLRSADSPLTPA